MTKEKLNYISNTNIKAAAQRYENLLDDKDRISEDMKELTKELKANGIDIKALKDAIKIKRKPIDESHEALVLGYLKAIGAQAEAA